jgi:hypothetical protein
LRLARTGDDLNLDTINFGGIIHVLLVRAGRV